MARERKRFVERKEVSAKAAPALVTLADSAGTAQAGAHSALIAFVEALARQAAREAIAAPLKSKPAPEMPP